MRPEIEALLALLFHLQLAHPWPAMTSPAQLEFGAVSEPSAPSSDRAQPARRELQPANRSTDLRPGKGAAPVRVKPIAGDEWWATSGELLTFDDASIILKISLRQVRRLVDSGKIGFVRV